MNTATAENKRGRLVTGRRDKLTGGRNYAKPNGTQVEQDKIFADADAEKIVLASMFDGGASNGEFPDADLFFYPSNKLIHQAIAGLKLRGVPVDLITVTQILRENGELDKAGGASAITEIGTDYYGKSPEIVKYELGKLHDCRALREQRALGEQMFKGEVTLEQSIEKLSALARECPSSLPIIRDATALIDTVIALPDDIIAGVLHVGGKAVLGGTSKSYKTWSLIDLAVSVATGTDWLGKFPTKKGRVLYVNLEIQKSFFAKRIRTICDERHLKLESGMLDVWTLRGHVMDFPRLSGQIPPSKYPLIVVDPIYKLLHDRDENKAGDIASLMNEMEVLTVRTGAAVAFGAHYSKGNQAQKESIDRIGGSGVFARDPDTIINFTRHEQDDCYSVEMTLRNHPPIEPFVVRWEYPLFVVDELLDPTRLKSPGRPELHRAKDLHELIDGPMSAGEIVKVAKDELGMDRRRVFELLDELKRNGRIKQPQKRGKYEPV
jgi:AAA domain-containing protein/DnaB helicase-like protein